MYNRYLENSNPSYQQSSNQQSCKHKQPECEQEHSGGLLSSLTGLLGGKEGGLSKLLDDNTLLVLIILYFLLKEDDGIDHDLIILAGVFLLLGL